MPRYLQGGLPQPLRIAHLGTYPPRRCGIATYTQDVLTALERYIPTNCPTVVAMTASGERAVYSPPVQQTISEEQISQYRPAARFLNSHGSDLLSIQFEHGIFGGEEGMYLRELLEELHLPAVATLHTVLPNPTPGQVKAVRALAWHCQALVVLNTRAIPLLDTAYGVDISRVSVIPHGTPQVDIAHRDTIRKRLGLEKRKVLMTFGLLGPGKGIEQAVEALALIARKHPTTDYYVLGQTHPELVRHEGESYRDSLMARVTKAGLKRRVRFVNRYLSLEEICDWLVACDIYLSPYQNPSQITSGTLAYAIAAGCPVISTPYSHACEILANDRGVLTPFGSVETLAQNISHLLEDEKGRLALGRAAYAYGESTNWHHTAAKYSELFQRVVQTRALRSAVV